MSDPKKQNEQQINIELDEATAQGEYSNQLLSTISSEFVVDFVAIMPGTQGQSQSRIILTPEHAKRFNSALADNIRPTKTVMERLILKTHHPYP